MSKVTLTDLVNLENETTAVSEINANNAAIEAAFDNTLSRDGTAPNQMGANLDMNSFRILNLPLPVSNFEPLRIIDVTTIGGGGTITVNPLPAGGTIGQALLKNSSTNFDVSWTTIHQVITGGTTGQALTKNSNTNFDYGWSSVLGGPVSSVVGNIAFFNNTNGTLVASGPAYQAGNPGRAGIYSNISVPTPPYTTVNNGFQFSQGTPISGTSMFGVNVIGLLQGIVGTCVIPAGDTSAIQGNGVAGYALTSQPTGGAGASAVGIFGQANTSVANASVFGGNVIAGNWNGDGSVIGFDTNYIAGFEIDVNIWKKAGLVDPVITAGHAYGCVVAGSSNIAAKISNSAAYLADMMSVNTSIPWDNGFLTYAGATVNGINLGQRATGATQESQRILLNGQNSSNVTKTAQIYADQNGSVIILPALAVTLYDAAVAPTIIVSAGLGSAGIQLPKIAGAAGFISNDASGNLSTTTANGTGSVVLTTSPALVTPSLGVATATTINGVTLNNTAWSTYTPTITAGTGTFTTVSATGRFKQIGKTVIAQADVTITTAGTAASTLFASLPVAAAAFNYVGSAMEITAGKSGAARIAPSGTTMGALDASTATFIANGKEVVFTITYEVP